MMYRVGTEPPVGAFDTLRGMRHSGACDTPGRCSWTFTTGVSEVPLTRRERSSWFVDSLGTQTMGSGQMSTSYEY